MATSTMITPANLDDFHQKIELLARRLEDGYRRIDEGINSGIEVADWEDFWISLLRQYENLCDQRQRAFQESMD